MPLSPELVPPPNISWGCLPRKSSYSSGFFPPITDSADFKPIPSSQWHSTSRRSNLQVKTIFNQLDGHCAANAAVWALMDLRSRMGLPEVVLSPECLYAQHSRWGTGSTLEENLQCLSQVGVTTRETMPQKDWSSKTFPSGWREEASRYRVVEWFDVPDWEHLISAFLLDFTCVIGLPWPGGGGHSVVAYDVNLDGSVPTVSGPNSWGSTWGDKGWYTLTQKQLRYMDSYGCWAARAAVYA